MTHNTRGQVKRMEDGPTLANINGHHTPSHSESERNNSDITDEEYVPGGDDIKMTGEEHAPSGNAINISDEEYVPSDNDRGDSDNSDEEYIPSGNDSDISDEEYIPSGNDSYISDKEYIPCGNGSDNTDDEYVASGNNSDNTGDEYVTNDKSSGNTGLENLPRSNPVDITDNEICVPSGKNTLQKRCSYTLDKKMLIMQHSDILGVTQAARKHNMPRRVLQDWRANRSAIIGAVGKDSKQRKRIISKKPPKPKKNKSGAQHGTELTGGPKRKDTRNAYPLQQKLQIITRSEAVGVSRAAREFNVSRRTLQLWRLQRSDIQHEVEKGRTNKNRLYCVRLKSRFKLLEEALVPWIEEVNSKGEKVSLSMIKAKALELTTTTPSLVMDNTTPYVANGQWCVNFLKRHSKKPLDVSVKKYAKSKRK